jgi:hypothetical protein
MNRNCRIVTPIHIAFPKLGDNMWNKDRSIDGSTNYKDAVYRVVPNAYIITVKTS